MTQYTTKKEIIDAILSIEKVDTFQNLNKKNKEELEKILSDLEPKSIIETPKETIDSLVAKAIQDLMPTLVEQAKTIAKSELEPEVETVKRKTRVELDRRMEVPVMNITRWSLFYKSSKTGIEVNWNEFGDVEYLELQEILSMRTSQKKFFSNPCIIILDDEVVEYLGLTKQYESIFLDGELDNVFTKDQLTFESLIEKSPKGVQHLIVVRAREKFEEGTLDSMNKIKFINDKFGTFIGKD